MVGVNNKQASKYTGGGWPIMGANRHTDRLMIGGILVLSLMVGGLGTWLYSLQRDTLQEGVSKGIHWVKLGTTDSKTACALFNAKQGMPEQVLTLSSWDVAKSDTVCVQNTVDALLPQALAVPYVFLTAKPK